MRRRACWLMATGALFAHPAFAASGSDFEVRVDDCPADLSDRMAAVVRLEVRVLLRERAGSAAFVDKVSVRCDGDAVRIDAMAGDAGRGSVVDLHAIAEEHRARAVGLAAAEVVDALCNDVEGDGAPLASPAVPTADRVENAPARAASGGRPAAALALGAVIERAGRPGVLLGGGRAELALRLGPLFASVIEAQGVTGEARTADAPVGVRAASGAAYLLVGTSAGRASWGLGPGARAGWVSLEGRPSPDAGFDASSVSAGWAGLAARARGVYVFGGEGGPVPFAALEADAGVVLAAVRGTLDGSRRVFSWDGPWLSLALSAGVAF
jgi:hypothetical protein